jgi:hypothetical protein
MLQKRRNQETIYNVLYGSRNEGLLMLYFEENRESDLQNSSTPQNLTPHHRTLEVRPHLRFYSTPML